ncbi:MAG: hypothetical protein MRERC_3c030 [Mycoplasmataceae bacterium RC_NB112A]|nr:MAG: hypothetical protein MRERC_3c030 [Mycoplasmataceae bacterium RC_NB112A]
MKEIHQLPKNFQFGEARESKFLLNTKQPGEVLKLLPSLIENNVNLVFFDSQYQPVRQVLPTNYPLYS